MKRQTTLLLIILSFTGFTLHSQEDSLRVWKVTGSTSLNFSQVSLTNWAEGGDGSTSGTFLFKIYANKKKHKHTWENAFELEYGLIKNEGQKKRKSVDKLFLSSKYGYAIGSNWYLSGLFEFRSQVDKGYNYPNTDVHISKFLAPGYINTAVGLEYHPNEQFSFLFAPASGKMTIVSDDLLSDAGAFGVDAGDRFRMEMGAYIKTTFTRKEVLRNVDFSTKLDLFSNYSDNPLNIDINWDLLFDMKINDYLSANLGFTVKFDDDIKYVNSDGELRGARTQLKQLLGVGLSYKF